MNVCSVLVCCTVIFLRLTFSHQHSLVSTQLLHYNPPLTNLKRTAFVFVQKHNVFGHTVLLKEVIIATINNYIL